MNDPVSNGKGRVALSLRVLPAALAMVFWLGGPGPVLLLALTSVVTGLVPALGVYVGKFVLDAAVDVIQTSGSPAAVQLLIRVLGIQLLLFLVSAFVTHLGSFMSFLVGKRLALNMKAQFLRRIVRFDYASLETSEFQDMLARAQQESSGKPLSLLTKLSSACHGVITFFTMSGLILTLSPALFLAMALVSLPLLLVQIKYGEKNYALEFHRTEESRMAGYVASIITNRVSLPEVLSLGLWPHLFQRWSTASHRFLRQDLRLRRKQIVAQVLSESLSVLGRVGATAYILYLAVRGNMHLTAGGIMMYTGAFLGGLSGLRIAFTSVGGIYEDALFFNNLVEFNRMQPRLESPTCGAPLPETIHTITFEEVSFRYPGGTRCALDHVNITFQSTQSTLLVGANGAGKTTLVKLLIRLYEPTGGRILINGRDIREFDVESLRKRIGVIFQQFLAFAFSAGENIGCGAIDALGDTPRIHAAAERARVHTMIEQLPHGYDTVLSKLFHEGCELSYGQWQRMCLARLFMKDAPVLVFDEPTASLDIESEAHLLQEIVKLSRDKLCILISHRSLRQGIADRIVVLDKGRVVEDGTFESLQRQNGEFARLLRLYHAVPKATTRDREGATWFRADGDAPGRETLVVRV
jgi:ATP-binding cassette subfamily B protein